MKIDKKEIVRRLTLLVDLCENTELAEPNEDYLFSGHLIESKELLGRAMDGDGSGGDWTNWTEIMKASNQIWKLRKKIEKHGWEHAPMAEMHDTIEDLLTQNQKINAIKYYRDIMDTHFDTKVTLKEAKEFVDNMQADLVRRGVIQ
jgi:hypothetical protein